MFTRRILLRGTTASAAGLAVRLPAARAQALDTPGVTATEIKFGQTMPYSGPASAYSSIGRTEAAYFRMINEAGGINGRKLNLVSVDDGYSPPKTVEQTRRLVEQENVAFIFQSLGTACNGAIRRYLNDRQIPHLFIASGSEKWADPKHFPWTIGYNPSTQTEAHIYAKAVLASRPKARIGLLYQNDDLGKDYVTGLKDGLGNAAAQIVKEESYEASDPTIGSQIISLKGSGADTFFNFSSPKFAAQAIRKVSDIGWRPVHYMANVSLSIGAVLKPAGLEKSKGIITTIYGKEPNDPHWKDDAGVKRFHAFMDTYMPGANRADTAISYGYSAAQTLVQVLRQCGPDLSRANILRQATNLKELTADLALPGMTMSTSPDNYHLIRQMQLARFNGVSWELFGELVSG